MYGLDGLQYLRRGKAFLDVTHRTKLDRLLSDQTSGEAGKNEDPALRCDLVQLRDGREAVHLGHSDIENDDVRLQGLCQLYGFFAVSGLADHFKTSVTPARQSQQCAYVGDVVDQ